MLKSERKDVKWACYFNDQVKAVNNTITISE